MPRGRGTFRQQDVTRALRAAKAAGLEVVGYEVDPATGAIMVKTGPSQPKVTPETAFDRWMANRERRGNGRSAR
jgi:hypothetical protein